MSDDDFLDIDDFEDDEVMEVDERVERNEREQTTREKEKPLDVPKLTDDYRTVQNAMEEVEESAKQLRFGLQLRRELEECESVRKGEGAEKKGTIEMEVETRWLHTDSLFLCLSVRNDSSVTLLDWTLTVTVRPLTYRRKGEDVLLVNQSQSISLGKMMPGEVFRAEVLLPVPSASLPLLLEFQMGRVFDLGGGGKPLAFRVPLHSHLVSLWDLCTVVDEGDSGESRERGKPARDSSLNIPCALVDLLSGCPDTDSASLVLSLFFPSSSVSQKDTVDVVCAVGRVDKQMAKLSVTKDGASFILKITARDSEFRSDMVADAQARLLLAVSTLRNRPVSSIVSLFDASSLYTLYQSVLQNYSN